MKRKVLRIIVQGRLFLILTCLSLGFWASLFLAYCLLLQFFAVTIRSFYMLVYFLFSKISYSHEWLWIIVGYFDEHKLENEKDRKDMP